MPYEQFRVMVAAINQANTQNRKEEQEVDSKKSQKGKITFKVVNE